MSYCVQLEIPRYRKLDLTVERDKDFYRIIIDEPLINFISQYIVFKSKPVLEELKLMIGLSLLPEDLCDILSEYTPESYNIMVLIEKFQSAIQQSHLAATYAAAEQHATNHALIMANLDILTGKLAYTEIDATLDRLMAKSCADLKSHIEKLKKSFR